MPVIHSIQTLNYYFLLLYNKQQTSLSSERSTSIRAWGVANCGVSVLSPRFTLYKRCSNASWLGEVGLIARPALLRCCFVCTLWLVSVHCFVVLAQTAEQCDALHAGKGYWPGWINKDSAPLKLMLIWLICIISFSICVFSLLMHVITFSVILWQLKI